MCNPAFLAVAGTAVSMAGQYSAGVYQSRMSRYQAQVAQQNKQLAREGAVDAIARGQDEQRALGRDVAARVGAQTARLAANNVDVTQGSAARTIADTRLLGAEEGSAIAENVRRQVKSLQIDAWGYESESRAARAEGSQAKTAAAFGMATTALGGATQYAKLKSRG